jgi:hypothetical protein
VYYDVESKERDGRVLKGKKAVARANVICSSAKRMLRDQTALPSEQEVLGVFAISFLTIGCWMTVTQKLEIRGALKSIQIKSILT